MPELYGKQYSKDQLLEYVGHISQIGGVQLSTFGDGPQRGVRYLEFRTGTGFNFKVCIDRGMDVCACEYQGLSLGLVPPTHFPGPWYFEDQAGFGWLRTAMGGLVNSCGLLHIGNPEEADISHYRFPARQKERYGVHDRIALTPGKLKYYGERWDGDECWIEAEGELIQAQVYGENLRLTRKYSTQLGESKFLMHDVVENCGYSPTTHMLLYHINLGFPFVSKGAEFIAPFSPQSPPLVLAGKENIKKEPKIGDPQSHLELHVLQHSLLQEDDGSVPIAFINQGLNQDSGLGIFIIYNGKEFPCFIESRQICIGHNSVSLEPCTNGFNREELERGDKLIVLDPGEKREYHLEIGILDGKDAIRSSRERISKLIS